MHFAQVKQNCHFDKGTCLFLKGVMILKIMYIVHVSFQEKEKKYEKYNTAI